MLRKLSAFILLSVSASAAYTQQTIEPRRGQTAESITGIRFKQFFQKRLSGRSGAGDNP